MSAIVGTPKSWMFREDGSPIRDESEFHEAMNKEWSRKYAGLSKPIFGMEILSLPDPRWALENLIQEEGLTMIHGNPGSGKSLMAMDWAYTLAHPELNSWMGQKKLRQYKPMYIFTEGFAGLRPRSEAWAIQRGVDIPGRPHEQEGVMWIRDAVRLNRQDREDNPWSEQVASLYKAYQDHDRDILFVDTLANTFLGNENSQQDTNNYLAGLRLFLQHGPVVVVHHNTKEGKDYRGSTVLEGAVDTKIAVKATGTSQVYLYITKQKDGDRGFSLTMRIKPHILKETSEYTVSAATLELNERGTEVKVTTKQGELLDILDENGPMEIALLAEKRESSVEGTANMLKRLKELGLVEQEEETLMWYALEREVEDL